MIKIIANVAGNEKQIFYNYWQVTVETAILSVVENCIVFTLMYNHEVLKSITSISINIGTLVKSDSTHPIHCVCNVGITCLSCVTQLDLGLGEPVKYWDCCEWCCPLPRHFVSSASIHETGRLTCYLKLAYNLQFFTVLGTILRLLKVPR